MHAPGLSSVNMTVSSAYRSHHCQGGQLRYIRGYRDVSSSRGKHDVLNGNAWDATWQRLFGTGKTGLCCKLWSSLGRSLSCTSLRTMLCPGCYPYKHGRFAGPLGERESALSAGTEVVDSIASVFNIKYIFWYIH